MLDTNQKHYFHLCSGCYLTFFRGEGIALNLEKDQYILLDESLSKNLQLILKTPFNQPVDGLIDDEDRADLNDDITHLQESEILSQELFCSPDSAERIYFNEAYGIQNVDWRAPQPQKHLRVPFIMVIEAFWTLLVTYTRLNFAGFASVIRHLKTKAQKCKPGFSGPCDFECLMAALHRAYFFFPKKIKCLEWSAALILMGLRRNRRCNLIIGVQKYPFLAHAWVEEEGTVIGDRPELSTQLSIILAEPFRRK